MTPEELANLTHLRRARDLIDRDYAKPLDVPTMARHALMSPAHFSRQFRAAYGETPYSYLMTRRIERAMALLRGGMSVTDACMTVGCTSLGSFSSRFTEVVGETPSSYRGRAHEAVSAMPACVAKVHTRPTRTPPGATSAMTAARTATPPAPHSAPGTPATPAPATPVAPVAPVAPSRIGEAGDNAAA
ncbi:helix-turn-helix transcriptional regulator [Streptomyces xanthochromogenes]|uniref:helix-turn-helix transcriptional regulator n=1 Tax=Streptomyces xanthochromogenes TaxID=67384 RepID=UPI00341EF2C4